MDYAFQVFCNRKLSTFFSSYINHPRPAVAISNGVHFHFHLLLCALHFVDLPIPGRLTP
jgi:hypothetical protein